MVAMAIAQVDFRHFCDQQILIDVESILKDFPEGLVDQGQFFDSVFKVVNAAFDSREGVRMGCMAPEDFVCFAWCMAGVRHRSEFKSYVIIVYLAEQCKFCSAAVATQCAPFVPRDSSSSEVASMLEELSKAVTCCLPVIGKIEKMPPSVLALRSHEIKITIGVLPLIVESAFLHSRSPVLMFADEDLPAEKSCRFIVVRKRYHSCNDRSTNRHQEVHVDVLPFPQATCAVHTGTR